MTMIFALMLAAMPPATAPAPDWRRLGTARDRIIYYDAARIERGPEVVTVRFRTEATQSPAASYTTLSRMEIRCASTMGRVIETISYAPDGKVIRTDTVPQSFEAIPANSPVTQVVHAVC